MFTLSQHLRLIISFLGLAGLTLGFFKALLAIASRVGMLQKKPKALVFISFLLSCFLSTATFLGASSFYVYYGFAHQPDIYRHGDRTLPLVAITFDDGPSPDFTPAILDILQQYEAPATFFLVGAHVVKYPEIAGRIVEEGHEIGNHTQTHRNVPTLSTLYLKEELSLASMAIIDATGQYPTYIRPPRGMYDGRFRRLATLMGQQIVLWTVSSRDWRYGVTAQAIVNNVISKVRNGDVILFHDSGALVRNEGGDRSATVKALPTIIEQLRQKGFAIVPLHVLLRDEAPQEVFPSVDLQE